jgi:hypothetical protein
MARKNKLERRVTDGTVLQDATPYALEHWTEMGAQSDVRPIDLQDDFKRLMATGRIEEAKEFLKWANAQVAKANRVTKGR